MPGMRDRDIDRMALLQNEWMPDLMTVVRSTVFVNAAGANTPVVTNAYTNLPCAITPRVLRQLAERELGGLVVGGIRWEVNIPRGTTIHMDDVLIVTNHETGQLHTLHVTGDLAPETWATSGLLNAVETE